MEIGKQLLLTASMYLCIPILLSIAIVQSPAQGKDSPRIIMDGYDIRLKRNGMGGLAESEYIYYFDRTSRSLKKFSEKYRGVSSKVSPRGSYVSFFGTDRADTKLFENGRMNRNLKLFILRMSGEDYKSFEIKPASYQWSPMEDRIAFLTPGESGEMATYPRITATWILDIKTGEKQKISDVGYELHWAAFDGNIYFSNPTQVYRYNSADGKIGLTPYKDLHFSDDGHYYISLKPESPFRLYVRATNEEITPAFESTVKKYMAIHSPHRTYDETSVRWFRGNQLVFWDDEMEQSYIFDVDRAAIIDSAAGSFIAPLDDGRNNTLIIEKGQIKVRTHGTGKND